MKFISSLVLLPVLLTACQSATPLPLVTASPGEEFLLAIGQSASISNADLSVDLREITSDARCPREVECVESGSVTLLISVQRRGMEPVEFIMKTYTDYDGRAPEGPFEGIQDRIKYEEFLVRVTSILPYPSGLSEPIEVSEYRVSFVAETRNEPLSAKRESKIPEVLTSGIFCQ